MRVRVHSSVYHTIQFISATNLVYIEGSNNQYIVKLRAFNMVWVMDLINKYISPPIDEKQEGISVH